ncbi:PIG-L family deacetylase [soil metagenome]
MLKHFYIVPALLFLVLLQGIPVSGLAQAPPRHNAADIQQALRKLSVLGSVLYMAAHPDDENTRLITYFANERLYNTAYLSLTRGDGGQNLIGPEIREELGVIRTQELLQARRTDGGKQFFSRANDFGFSKDAQETLQIWDKEQVLSDAVWVIRKFRPDVIITRFSPVPGGTHGHHTASAMLAVEAFTAAADKNRFPEQLQYVEVWQPKRILWNTSYFFFGSERQFDPTGKLAVDVGGYNPLLGKSYTEIAAESRSMHKSQGFGSSGTRGSAVEYLEPLQGPPAKKDPFEDIDVSWARVAGSKQVASLVQRALQQFRPADPAAVVPTLLQVHSALQKMPASHWKAVKQQEVEEVIQACLGLYLEATARDYAATPGQEVQLRLEAVNRSKVPVRLNRIQYGFARRDTLLNHTLAYNEPLNVSARLMLPADIAYTHPYWLRQEGTVGMFAVEDQQLIGLPENPPAAQVQVTLQVNQTPLELTVPVVFKRTDPVEGEQYRPFEVTPPVLVNLAENVYMFADDQPKTLSVVVTAGKNNVQGEVGPQMPAGWRSEPASHAFDLKQKGDEVRMAFMVYPPKTQSDGQVRVQAKVGGKNYSLGQKSLPYTHIPNQTLFPEATARVVRLDLKRRGETIGYIVGAGDEVPRSLEQIGYRVEVLRDDQIQPAYLKRFDAIVVGVRAYNTVDRLRIHQPKLLDYVQNGGTLIVQYNTSGGLVTPALGPYPLRLSRDRVTVEEAPVTLLKPEHPVLNTPNKITGQDFEGWVQERGLYFPGEWSPEYQAILATNDPGEKPLEGGLLVAKYGKGHYIYTGYSWFRQLPAGVPGAYRLFTNMLSIGRQ